MSALTPLVIFSSVRFRKYFMLNLKCVNSPSWKLIYFLLCALLILCLMPVMAVRAQASGWGQNIGDAIFGTAVSGNGSVQIIGSRNNRVAAYNAAGTLLWEFKPGGTVWGVATAADGQLTAAASEDRKLYLLDNAGKPIWSFRSSRSFLSVAISGDGSRIFASDDGRQVYFFNRETGQPIWQSNVGNIADTVSIFGTGTDKIRAVAGTRDSNVILFDSNGKEVWRTQMDDQIVSVAADGAGTHIVVGTLDGKVTLLNAADAKIIWQTSLPKTFTCNAKDRHNCVNVALSANAERILVGALTNDVYLLNGTDGKVLQTQQAANPVTSVTLSADAGTLLFGTREGQVHSSSAAAATSAFNIVQDQQRVVLFGTPILLLLATVAFGTWVRGTSSGRYFWTVRLLPVRYLLGLIWRSRISYLLLLPTILLLVMFNYYPALSGLYHSFTIWKPGVETKWVGMLQFQAMLNSPYFWTGVKNAVILVLSAFAKLTVPLLIAELIFHIRSGAIQYFVRTLFVIPLVVPGIVSILLWVNIYDPNIGLLSQTLQALGLSHLAPPGGWLGDKNTALPSIIAIGFPWISPFALLIFYGGLIGIPQELFDAAKVDGVTVLSRFWRLDLPLLMSQIKLLLILAFIGSVQEFQSIFLTTGGGPGDVTYTPSLELYYQATRFNNFGLASAMGTIIFLIILVGTILNLRYVRSQTEYEAA